MKGANVNHHGKWSQLAKEAVSATRKGRVVTIDGCKSTSFVDVPASRGCFLAAAATCAEESH